MLGTPSLSRLLRQDGDFDFEKGESPNGLLGRFQTITKNCHPDQVSDRRCRTDTRGGTFCSAAGTYFLSALTILGRQRYPVTLPAETFPPTLLSPQAAIQQPRANCPMLPDSATAPRSRGRGSCPTPPYSARPPEAFPLPATRRTADKSISGLPPTSAADALPPSAQTYTPRPICLRPQFLAGIVST
jgi:hypothetical protein